MTRVHVLTPVAFDVDGLETVRHIEGASIELSHSTIDDGTDAIMSDYDIAMSSSGVVRAAIAAEENGAEAVVINCMADPALDACRERLGVPVFGCGQTTMHVAALVGHRFSVLPTMAHRRIAYEKAAIRYGLAGKLASVRPTGIPVREIDENPESLNRLVVCARKAIEEDGADTIIFGCTHFSGFGADVREQLAEHNLAPSIILPLDVTVRLASTLVQAGIGKNTIVYPGPKNLLPNA